MFSIIAHDLRSPLNSMIGLSELLESDFETFDANELRELLNAQNKVGHALLGLLENLLQWSRLNLKILKPTIEEVSLTKIATTLLAENKATLILKNLTIVFDNTTETFLNTDKNLINTALRNLISNALKFSKKGGIITIEISETTLETKISVKDEGIGMPEKLKENLFNPVFKTNRPGTENEPSSGLGLILVSEIAKLLGASIIVISKENEGTCVNLNFPKSENQNHE